MKRIQNKINIKEIESSKLNDCKRMKDFIINNKKLDKNIINVLINTHPLQFLSLEDIYIQIWKVKYKYNTRRMSEKTSEKIIQIKSDYDSSHIDELYLDYQKMNVESRFKRIIEKENNENPYKKTLNVKVLNVKYVETIKLI